MIDLALALLITPVAFLAPGYWIVRRLPWTAEEKLAAAPALSLLLLGSAGFVIFALGLHPLLHLVIVAVCIALGLAAAPAAARFLRRQDGRSIAGPLLLVVVTALALSGWVRSFSGGAWYGDWLEHYDRSRFFLGRLRTDVTFQTYGVTARPPLLNCVAAHLMAVSGGRFAAFQVACALAGATAFTACLQLARLLAPSRTGVPRRVAAWLVTLPAFAANVAIPLTKMTAAAFVVAGTALYVASWRERDVTRLRVAAALLAGGVLTHYSAVPYALFIALHALLAWRGGAGRRLWPLATSALVAATILAPWVAWSARVYGPAALVTATSTWRDGASQPAAERADTVVLNLLDTLTPHPLQGSERDVRLAALSWGLVHDASFRLYQTSAPFILGSAGAGFLVYEWIRRRRGRDAAGAPERRFWAAYVLCTLPVAVASFSGRDTGGVAHVVLQPLVLLATSALAACNAGWGPIPRVVAALSRAVDALFGVALHGWFQSYRLDMAPGWRGPFGLRLEDLLMGSGEGNWQLKGYLTFLGDHLASTQPLLAATIGAILLWACFAIARPDRPPAAP